MEDNIYYVYRHIRLDKNQVFYIGLGRNKRAWDKHSRNRYWNHIVKNTDYEVEIILGDLTRQEASEKEKEFIKLYGRIDLGFGTLVNMTDGGDGGDTFTNNPRKEEIRKKLIGRRGPNKGSEKWNHIKDDIITDIKSGFSEREINIKYGISKGSIHRLKKKYIK